MRNRAQHLRLALLTLLALFAPVLAYSEQFCANQFPNCQVQTFTLNTPSLGAGTHLSIASTDAVPTGETDYRTVRVTVAPVTHAAASVGAGVWSTWTNNTTNTWTTGHAIAVFGNVTESATAVGTLYGVEGRCDGRSTVAAIASSCIGVAGRSLFQGASLSDSRFFIAHDSSISITTDGSTPLANATAIHYYAPAIVGGLVKYSFLGADPIRGTGGLQTPGSGGNSLVHGTSAVASASFAMAFGDSASSAAAGGICLGSSCLIGASHTGSVGVGYTATTTAAQQLVIGSSSANLAYITDAYIGSGVTDATPKNFKLHATGGTGSNIAGANAGIYPGIGTGTGAGAQAELGRDLVTTTGSTAHNQTQGLVVCESKTLSNTSATTTALATIGSASNTAGGASVTISVVATDGTNFDVETQTANFSFINKAGVFTISTPTITTASPASGSGSTTIGFTATGASSLISVKATPVFTTLVPTSVTAYTTIINNSAGAVVCQ
jgi:hypothetical protein